jgi:hypothetical protein
MHTNPHQAEGVTTESVEQHQLCAGFKHPNTANLDQLPGLDSAPMTAVFNARHCKFVGRDRYQGKRCANAVPKWTNKFTGLAKHIFLRE